MAVLPESPAGPPARVAVPGTPDDQKLTAAAELRIIMKEDDSNRVFSWLRRLLPAAIWLRVMVPDAEAGQLLRTLERVTVAVTWPTTVIGTLFGASAAHLPPAGTTTVVVLEIVAPAVMLRARRGDSDK
jgi:hypothetical protein